MNVTTSKQRSRSLWVVFVDGRGVGEVRKGEGGFVPCAWIGKVADDGFRVCRSFEEEESIKKAALVVAAYVSKNSGAIK